MTGFYHPEWLLALIVLPILYYYYYHETNRKKQEAIVIQTAELFREAKEMQMTVDDLVSQAKKIMKESTQTTAEDATQVDR